MGSDSESSAQSKHGGAGVKHGSTKLDGLLTRDGGCKTAAVESVDVLVAMEDMELVKQFIYS